MPCSSGARGIGGSLNKEEKGMNMSATKDREYEEKLREYERIHAMWMKCPVHTAESKRIWVLLDAAMEGWTSAVKERHPSWIVM